MHPLTFFLLASFLPNVQLMEDLKALEEFVNRPDPHYEYTFVKEEPGLYTTERANFHYINMTSQKWLDETEVDKAVWSHELIILYPTKLKYGESCLLIVSSGEIPPETFLSELLGRFSLLYLAVRLKLFLALLTPVPIQPLTFYKHPLGRENIKNYDIMAYSWWRFINDSSVSPEMLVQFPMVKAAVRAMDTITDYVMETFQMNITKFTLAGIAMNGWTTWLTAAVDSRVDAIIPVAMDFLNFTENFLHQYRSYCGWSYGLKPFIDMNITQKLDDPGFARLASLVDPLAYNERYTNVAKLIIILSGEDVFLPDNTRHYFAQLKGEKHLRLERKNTVPDLVAAFYDLVARDKPRPNISLQITTDVVMAANLEGSKSGVDKFTEDWAMHS
ncbi:autocrine proliferation repressor protein A-like [Heteronotia binoei]|uniref:autocrine proliferation repressor protein A-like n=1 Tax=Heteronotia binoei TaxID=13085 RepID=UPI00293013DD|nr:autocrine proliferation repressor protein A-like [Heteronotia binoei]